MIYIPIINALYFQALEKLLDSPIASTVEYRYGDDNNGRFIFPSISICPKKFNQAFGPKLIQACSNSTIYQSAQHAMEMCAGFLTDIHDIVDLIDFDIDQLISMIIVGEFRASSIFFFQFCSFIFEYTICLKICLEIYFLP